MTALKINLISLPMGSVLWKHKKPRSTQTRQPATSKQQHTTCSSNREGKNNSNNNREQRWKNDEDLQSGKTRNGNKNHIFTGAWRLRRTSHLIGRWGYGGGFIYMCICMCGYTRRNPKGRDPQNIRNYVFFINSAMGVGGLNLRFSPTRRSRH